MNADEARKISSRPEELIALREKINKEIQESAEKGYHSCDYYLYQDTQPYLWPLIEELKIDGFKVTLCGEADSKEGIRVSISWHEA